MTEQHLENTLIRELQKQNYIYKQDIRDVNALNKNFREHLEKRNQDKFKGTPLTDKEFDRLLDDIKTADIYKASETLRGQYALTREDSSIIYLSFFNSNDWCTNDFEVVNQFVLAQDQTTNRYDVILLINGLPLVHIELKRDSITPRRALEQIERYKKNNAHGIGNSLFCFVQIFIVATESLSYYCVNNDLKSFQTGVNSQFLPIFTWSDKDNNKLNHLITEFTPNFLDKCFISKMIARYIVLIKTKRKLMILRAYQVHATESIMEHLDNSYKNGYIWHTTGSGKTLTSFKCATILRDKDEFDKILFVVDRKDLDKQTIDEFNKFEEKCVDKTKNTKELVKRLASDNKESKVIVTTLQKLTRFLESDPPILNLIKDKKIVFIFDECHRSQFGESNKLIRKTFTNHRMIGFTGTPIFPQNASASNKTVNEHNEAEKTTTEHIFCKPLHKYLIKDAINDKNVLPFHIDYFKAIDEQATDEQRKTTVVKKILEMYPNATSNGEFNAIFAVSSIKNAIAYYNIFKQEQENTQNPIAITTIFSPPPSINSNHTEDLVDEEKDYREEPSKDEEKAEALQRIIDDYNLRYKTSFNMRTSFDSYYDDVSQRVKNHQDYKDQDKAHQQINILLVVDMFLTGFDSPYTNSLFVDKELQYHSLIQAFSRTNRVINNNKLHGNIYCFTDLAERVDDAIILFSGDNSDSNLAKTIWLVDSLEEVKKRIATKISILEQVFQNAGLSYEPASVPKLNPIQQKEFIEVFRDLQKDTNAIVQYMDYDENLKAQLEAVLPKDLMGAFRMQYIECALKDKDLSEDFANNNEILDIDYALELFKTEITSWEYIVNLVNNSVKNQGTKHKYTKDNIITMIKSDPSYTNHSALIIEFFDYCEQNNYFKNVTEQETLLELHHFAQKREREEWTSLLERYPSIDALELKKFQREYNNFQIFDKTLLKNALGLRDIGLLKRIPIQNKIINEIHTFLNKYHVKGAPNETSL